MAPLSRLITVVARVERSALETSAFEWKTRSALPAIAVAKLITPMCITRIVRVSAKDLELAQLRHLKEVTNECIAEVARKLEKIEEAAARATLLKGYMSCRKSFLESACDSEVGSRGGG